MLGFYQIGEKSCKSMAFQRHVTLAHLNVMFELTSG